MTTPTPPIEKHPDLTGMRVRYEQMAETPMVQVADGLAFLSGLYLAMSPWVVGFTDHSALTMANIFVGITVALLAIGFASAFGRTHGIVWVAPLLGLWTIVAPWVVADAGTPATAAIFSNVIVGALIVLLTLPQLWVGVRSPRT
jgi:hypothetical protein